MQNVLIILLVGLYFITRNLPDVQTVQIGLVLVAIAIVAWIVTWGWTGVTKYIKKG